MTVRIATAAATDQLYARYAPLVLRRARMFVDGAAAEDVVHDVFIKVMEHWEQFRGEAQPSTWLYRITTHVCLNRLRDDQRRRRLLSENYGAVPGVNQPTADPAGLALLSQLWKTLDEDLARVGIYYHLDGMTHDDIAALLGCSAATVRNRLKAIEQHARDAEEARP